jgi:O-antigen biosynthesis protein WbqP
MKEVWQLYLFIKKLMDKIIALVGLAIVSPLFLTIMLAIKIESKGHIFFKQKRVGIYKTTFYIIKFRTMRMDTPKDIPTHQLQNPAIYITKIGRFLRRTSLDELPQLINIIKGEMSFVGPRPALWNQEDLIAEREKYHANDVPVGLTGWAQINGRDELEIKEKAKLDGEYANRIGLLMDIRCFFGTFLSIMKAEGVVEGGTGQAKSEDKK